MVVVGLPPNADIQALQNLYSAKKFEGSGRFRSAVGGQHLSCVEPNIEPQVLFVYPPEKQLPIKYKDLLSFCFPAGVEVNTVERTPSMSELNEIFLGQEHLKQSDLSFVFRLQVADDSSLYGCCVLVEEIIQKPSGLISMISDGQPLCSNLSRHILTTRRCYCILSRLPFFELHFGVLNRSLNAYFSKKLHVKRPDENYALQKCALSIILFAKGGISDGVNIFAEERLEQLTKEISYLDLESPFGDDMFGMLDEKAGSISPENEAGNTQNGKIECSESNTSGSISGSMTDDMSPFEHKNLNGDSHSKNEPNGNDGPLDTETEKLASCKERAVNDNFTNKQSAERRLPNAVLPFLRYQQCESSESSSSFQGSPSEDRHFRSDVDEAETEEASSSGQDIFSEHSDILEWAKANSHGSLQIISEYYQLCCPERGSPIKFHPLDHLHPLEYHRPDETVDSRACKRSLELAEAHSVLVAEEEAAALSVWAISCLCGTLRLEHVLTLFAGALLEKQIVVVCSNLVGNFVCISSVNYPPDSTISVAKLVDASNFLLRSVLPNDMLDFLDAPVGVKSKTTEVQSKLTNAILVDANRNQVKSPTIPQLPQHRELYSSLSPYHAKLIGESYLGKKRPVYECTDVQAEAAKGFLGVLRSYLDSLCSNLRSHTITNVQSNDDKLIVWVLFLRPFSVYHCTLTLSIVAQGNLRLD
ncbi:hypothetical protein DH2020_014639 [Rehmannia glutinosa]|uniref:cDENN domain-containing protein n=1 Tax=Rehmannia glutinosa TaxID=99300 RepID=A0ABR0WXX5_REHGL